MLWDFVSFFVSVRFCRVDNYDLWWIFFLFRGMYIDLSIFTDCGNCIIDLSIFADCGNCIIDLNTCFPEIDQRNPALDLFSGN